MNIQLLSDIHGRIKRLNFDEHADIALFPGDASESLDITFKMLKSFPIPSFYLPGNHEFYHKEFFETYFKLQDFCETTDGDVIFIDKQTAEIGDVRILGTTLWSDFENFNTLIVESSWLALNDYRKIKTELITPEYKENCMKLHLRHIQNIEAILNGNDLQQKSVLEFLLKRRCETFGFSHYKEINLNLFTPHFAYILNKENKFWLDNALSQPFEGKTVIMSHHSPSSTPLLLGKYIVSPSELYINNFVKRNKVLHKIGGYCNSLENLALKHNITTWVHGHFHEFLNYRLGNSSVFCNPTGNNKDHDMSYQKFLIKIDDSEQDKVKSLKYQLKHFLNTCDDLLYFFQIQLNEKVNISNLNSVSILKSYWREIEILLNNIHSLPYLEIDDDFINFYPDPFLEIEKAHNEELNTNETVMILNIMFTEVENIYFKIKNWIEKL